MTTSNKTLSTRCPSCTIRHPLINVIAKSYGSVAIIAILLFATPSFATTFLPNFEDIPQMEKTLAVEQTGFLFSTPDGHIIETIITSDSVSRREFQRYYEKTLESLGWKLKNDSSKLQTFIRDNDTLKIEILETAPLTARFSLTPSE